MLRVLLVFLGVGEPTLNNPRHRGRLRGSIDLLVVSDGSVGGRLLWGELKTRGPYGSVGGSVGGRL